MKNIEKKCQNTTRHIADKILQLRRAKKLTQEKFAEKTGLDRRTVARAEDGKHRPSAESMELIADAFNIPVSYFYDDSTVKTDLTKSALIHQISAKLNIQTKSNLRKILSMIDIISGT